MEIIKDKWSKLISNSEFLWTLAAQVVQLFSGVILVKILTSQLTVQSYGYFSLTMAVNAFVLTVPFTAIQQGFYRYRSLYNKKNKSSIFFSSMLMGLTGLVVLYFLLSLILIKYIELDEFWKDNLYIVSLLVVSEIYKVFLRAIINADRKRKTYAKSIMLEFILKIVSLLLLFNIYNEDVSLVLCSYFFANILSCCVCIRPYLNNLNTINLKLFLIIWKRIAFFSTPLMIWAVFGWTRDMSLRWFVDGNFSTTSVGLFSAIASIVVIIPMVIQSVVGAYFIPILYENDKGESKNRVEKSFNKLINLLYLCGLILFIITYAFSDIIIILISDEKYTEMSWAMPWMFISYFLFVVGMIKATNMLVNFKPGKLLLPNLISGVIVLFSGFFVIPGNDFYFVIMTYCLSYLSYFIFVEYVIQKEKR